MHWCEQGRCGGREAQIQYFKKMRIGVVGAGPAGMTFAGRVLKKARNATLNIFDSRPEPFGLVRYGIAPDHPEVRVCSLFFCPTNIRELHSAI